MSYKNILAFAFLFFSSASLCQTTVTTSDLLNSKPVFIGGGLVLGGGAHSFQMGLNPELIKSFNTYIDGGIAMNIYYEVYNASELNTIKSKNFRLGMGAFTRIWPIESFFIQIQPEYNYAWLNQKDMSTGQSGVANFGAESLLTGIGYGKRNEWGISYFSIMYDLLDNPRSQYKDAYNRREPVFRAGIGFPLKFGIKKKH
jgi:hypothetical protein